MGAYRLFCFDANKHVTHRRDFDAIDDEAAITFGRTEFPLVGCEIWELGRKVAVLSAAGPVKLVDAILKMA